MDSSLSPRALPVVRAADLPDDFAAVKHLLARDGGALVYHASVAVDPPHLALLGERALYVYDKEGSLQRCVDLRGVEEVVESGTIVGLRVPSEYDLRLVFDSADALHFLDTLCVLYRRGCNKSLPVRSISSSEHLSRHLWLSPPADWVPKPLIPFSYDSGGNELTVVEDLVSKQLEIERLRKELRESSSASALTKLEVLEQTVAGLAKSIHETPQRSPVPEAFTRSLPLTQLSPQMESPYSPYSAHGGAEDDSVLHALTVKLTNQVAAATNELGRLKEQSQHAPQVPLVQPMYMQPHLAPHAHEGDLSLNMYVQPGGTHMSHLQPLPQSPTRLEGIIQTESREDLFAHQPEEPDSPPEIYPGTPVNALPTAQGAQSPFSPQHLQPQQLHQQMPHQQLQLQQPLHQAVQQPLQQSQQSLQQPLQQSQSQQSLQQPLQQSQQSLQQPLQQSQQSLPPQQQPLQPHQQLQLQQPPVQFQAHPSSYQALPPTSGSALLSRVATLEAKLKSKGQREGVAMTLGERLAKLEGWIDGKAKRGTNPQTTDKVGTGETVGTGEEPALNGSSIVQLSEASVYSLLTQGPQLKVKESSQVPAESLALPSAPSTKISKEPSVPLKQDKSAKSTPRTPAAVRRSFWGDVGRADSVSTTKSHCTPQPVKTGGRSPSQSEHRMTSRSPGKRQKVQGRKVASTTRAESWGNIEGIRRVDSEVVAEPTRGHAKARGKSRERKVSQLSFVTQSCGTAGDAHSRVQPERTPIPTPANPVRYRCVTEGLFHTMRDQPSKSAPKTGEVRPGDEVDVVGQQVDSEGQLWVQAAGGGWLLQRVANDEIGTSEFMAPVETVTKSALSTGVRGEVHGQGEVRGGGHLVGRIQQLEDTQQCELTILARQVRRLEETVAVQQGRMSFELEQQKELLAFHQRRQTAAHGASGSIQLMPPKGEAVTPMPSTPVAQSRASSDISAQLAPFAAPPPVSPVHPLVHTLTLVHDVNGLSEDEVVDKAVSPPRSPRGERGTRFRSPRSPHLRQLRSMSPAHPDSVQRTGPSVLRNIDYPQKLKQSRSMSPGVLQTWRVIGAGSIVRSEIGLDSRQVGVLPQATLVDVSEMYGNRAHVITPMKGWVSLCADSGAPLLVPSSKTAPKAAPKRARSSSRSVLSPRASRTPSARKPFR